MLLTFVGVGFFAANNAATFENALGGLQNASLPPIFLGVLLSVTAVINRGYLNRASHAAVGLDADPLPMAKTAAVGFAANKVVKVAGASGLAVFVRHGKRRGFAGSSVAAACIVAAGSSFVALSILVIMNMVLMGIAGELSAWWLTAGVGFLAYTGLLFLVGWFGKVRRESAHRAWAGARRFVSKVRRKPVDDGAPGLDEFYRAMTAAGSSRVWTVRVLIHAVISKTLGVGMLFAAAMATGLPISIPGVLLIYTTGLVAALFSVLPGGLGMVEATTAALLVSGGAPVALAVVVVALYRVFDLWIPVAVGAVFGRNDFKRTKPASAHVTPAQPRTLIS